MVNIKRYRGGARAVPGAMAVLTMAAFLVLPGEGRAQAPQAKPAAAPAKRAPAPAPAAAPAPAPAAPGTAEEPKVKVERGAGGKKVYRITEAIRIEGKIQKPEAFYVLQKSSINYDWQDLKQDFIPKILESVAQAPF
jgi:pyruvate/2-oxoglutarate dehydrogenase complex dihydrolipoamide acyltransferase (E2) component